jgi:hypothetical protein
MIYRYTTIPWTPLPGTKDIRITYIALLLIFGLISAVGAGAVAGAILFYSRATTITTTTPMQSAQAVRQLDGLRLVVDSIAYFFASARRPSTLTDLCRLGVLMSRTIVSSS